MIFYCFGGRGGGVYTWELMGEEFRGGEPLGKLSMVQKNFFGTYSFYMSLCLLH